MRVADVAMLPFCAIALSSCGSRGLASGAVEQPAKFGYPPVNGLRIYFEIHGTANPEHPALVIVGDADVIRPEHAVEMFRALPQAQLTVLPGTDPMKATARTKWLVPMISAFLDTPATQ